jgi:glyoxylase-like metal-dependent hydrolase (beta-lactamase superfamily II)
MILTLVAALAGAAWGQGQDFSKVEIKTNKVTNNFYTLDGQGGTIGVLVSPDSILMVDAQFAPLSDKIAAAIRKISNAPIKVLINTHVHGDHTGGNENFAKMGAAIMSRDQLRFRLAHPNPGANGAPAPAAPAAALPAFTYDGPVTLHTGGGDVELIPIRNAHTDGDTLVHLVSQDVLMTGDYYRSLGYPNMDIGNGGSYKGMVEGLGRTIGLAGPNTKIIPGHGDTVDRNAVAMHRDIMLAVRAKIEPMVAQGRSVEDVIAAKPTAEFDAKVPQGTMTSERFIRQVYAEVKAGR